MISDAFDQAEARDPKHLRPWVVPVDGPRHQPDLISAETGRGDARSTSDQLRHDTALENGWPIATGARGRLAT